VTLLKAIGQGVEVHEIDPALVTAALRELQHRHKQRRAPGPASPS
jgi:hypothetical protein